MSQAHSTLKIGDRYGRLVIAGDPVRISSPTLRTPRRTLEGYPCVCDCGNTLVANKFHMLQGLKKSCGCFRRDNGRARKNNIKHGMARADGTKPPEYQTWVEMRNRCSNQKHHAWSNYGGRGITVCPEWQNDFVVFFEDMGPRPSSSHGIDRIDNNAGYCKANCRWATRKEQANNRRTCLYFEMDGRRQTKAEWCREFGISPNVFNHRHGHGWSLRDVLTTPVRRRSRKTQSKDCST